MQSGETMDKVTHVTEDAAKKMNEETEKEK
jgi:hypothetical protein